MSSLVAVIGIKMCIFCCNVQSLYCIYFYTLLGLRGGIEELMMVRQLESLKEQQGSKCLPINKFSRLKIKNVAADNFPPDFKLNFLLQNIGQTAIKN